MAPNLYMIAGPNGAGKTTFATEFLPAYAYCPHFVNADLIAQGVSPFAPERAAFRAGRIMLDEIERLAMHREDFGIETTLSGRTLLNLIRRFKRDGYATHLFFLWVPSEELAISRIKGRVKGGGHDIPSDVVRRRFSRSLSNFFNYYRHLADSWMLFDNSAESPRVVAFERDGALRIIENAVYEDMLAQQKKNET